MNYIFVSIRIVDIGCTCIHFCHFHYYQFTHTVLGFVSHTMIALWVFVGALLVVLVWLERYREVKRPPRETPPPGWEGLAWLAFYLTVAFPPNQNNQQSLCEKTQC